MIPWSRTVGRCRRRSAHLVGILTLVLQLRTPGATTGSAREKLRHHDKRRVTARQDITATDTVTILLLLASDLWQDFHMYQVGWTPGLQTTREIKLMTLLGASCTQIPRKVCKPSKPACRKVPHQECQPTTERKCHAVAKPHCSKVARKVPRQECGSVEKEHCQYIPEETCHTIAEEKCRPVRRERCEQIPHTHCVGKLSSISH